MRSIWASLSAAVTRHPLVIAVGTEFSVLVAARYAEERRRGLAPGASVTAPPAEDRGPAAVVGRAGE